MKKKPVNKKLILTLAVLSSISYFGSNLNVKTTTVSERQPAFVLPHLKPKPVPATSKQTSSAVLREPGSNEYSNMDQKRTLSFAKGREEVKTYEGYDHPALPSGYQFAKNIFAVKKSEYTSALGEIAEEKNGYIFFSNDQKPEDTTNVVVNQKDNKLYAISSVLKLENIDESLRNSIVAKGMEEHYYSEDLKVMYVQSNQEDLLKLHQELQSLKLNPQVEIIHAYHRPR
jgi:hypothetical protein